MRGGIRSSSDTPCLSSFRYTTVSALHAFSSKALSDAFFSLDTHNGPDRRTQTARSFPMGERRLRGGAACPGLTKSLV